MAEEIRLWAVDGNDRLIEVSSARLDLEERLHRWSLQDASVIADDVLVIGTEVETDAGGYVDLLALDREGNLVVIELKRGRTPREVTAQALDYGAWAHRLSSEEIVALSTQLLSGGLDAAFRDQFGEPLPEVLGESHRLLIVATHTDDRTERIVQYLSEVYGVDINVLTFSFFRTPDGRELLGRTFLIEPEAVEQRSQSRPSSKRLPDLTREQLRDATEKVGLADAYDMLVEALDARFSFGRTRTAAAFRAKLDGGPRATFNVVVTESDPAKGLKFIVYASRLARALGVNKDDVLAALPPDARPWAYVDYESTSEDWRGYEGYMQAVDVERFVAWLHERDVSP